jgi:hypothetical protein
MPELDENVDESWGGFEGQCQGCDLFGRLNDLLLCEDCAAKLERDLIRQRDWDYSATAFGLSPDARESWLQRYVLERIRRGSVFFKVELVLRAYT